MEGATVGEVREVDIPDGEDGVEVEGGISTLEGIGMGEVSDGTGELKEPVMLLILNDKERSDDSKRRKTKPT